MNTLKTTAACLLLMLTGAGATAQQTRILTADKHNEYGLVYRLPITALSFEVTARHTSAKAGPYYQYAKRFVGTDKVVTSDYDQWEITDVKVTPFGVPDADNEYLMQVKAGALTSICVADNGMLLAINKEVSDKNPVPAQKGNSERKGRTSEDSRISPTAYLEFVTEDFLASQSSAKQAQMLAESIMEVRDARVSLTRGTAETMPTDGRQLELMLQSLEKQEKSMTAAFTGVKDTESVTRTFVFTPDEEGKFVLFRLSDFDGFTDNDDYSGEPVYVSVSITREESLPVDAKGNEKDIPKDAVIYNIPGAARISLSYQGRTLWSDEIDCSQYGIQFGLQPSLFSDKKNRSSAEFNPVTGGLINIEEIRE